MSIRCYIVLFSLHFIHVALYPYTQVDPLKVPGGVGGTQLLLGGEVTVGWEFPMANNNGRSDDELGRVVSKETCYGGKRDLGGKGRPGRPPKSNEMKLKKNEKVWGSDGGRGAGGAGGAICVGGWTVGMEAKTSAFVSPAVIAPKQVDGGGGGGTRWGQGRAATRLRSILNSRTRVTGWQGRGAPRPLCW